MKRPSYHIPAELEASLRTVVPPIPLKKQATAVAELSALFTTHRAMRPKNYFADPAHRAAYVTYFLPANYNKLHAVFDEMRPLVEAQLNPDRPETKTGRPLFRVLDLGAGPGTMTLAAMEYLVRLSPEQEFEFVAVDSNREMLSWCRRIFYDFVRRLGLNEARINLRIVAASFLQFLHSLATEAEFEKAFDVIVMANAWSELVDATEAGLETEVGWIERLLNHLSHDGSLVLIEPALRETSRRLHHLRDAVLERVPVVNVFAPCVHSCSCPCVAAGNEKDWCHDEFEWSPTEEITSIDRLIGNRKDALKFSYLVLRKDGKNVLHVRGPSDTTGTASACWRVVSERMEEKGKKRVFLCGQGGRFQFTRLERDTVELNGVFGKIARGDVVRIENAEPREREWRVTRQTRVTKV
jgi:ribosomal protein RSM22 (predicted rRNA methylase)